MDIEVAGETFQALPERALYSPRTETLFVADLHLGKTETFRAAGTPLPDGASDADLVRLKRLIDSLSPRRLIVLGDLIHGRAGLTERAVERFACWRRDCARLHLTLVRGNHDADADRLAASWDFEIVDEPFAWAGISLRHRPVDHDGPQLAGHLHPAARLAANGLPGLRLPCFWIRGNRVVLPAFTQFSGTMPINVAEGDRVLVIADGELFDATRDAAPA